METYHYMLYRINFQKGSYPTYEEWKPIWRLFWSFFKSWFLSYLWGMETLSSSNCPVKMSFRFLSYLWGMETQWNSRIKLKKFLVLILPMRNGNMRGGIRQKKYQRALILPMRNGNYFWHLMKYPKLLPGSYPTYEEWKLSLPFFKCS